MLVVQNERPHGSQQFTSTQHGGIDGQEVGAMAQNHLIPSPFKGVVPSQHSSILGVGPYGGLTVHFGGACARLHRWVTQSISDSHSFPTPTPLQRRKK